MFILLKLFCVSLVSFIILDLVWLGFVAKKFYQKNLGELLAKKVNWYAAGIFYIIFNLGMIFFVMIPSFQFESWYAASIFGAAFGLVTYATYDLTNFATLESWPLRVVLVDILWGIFIGASVATITFWSFTLLA